MAQKDGTFLMVAAGLGLAAWFLLRPKVSTGSAPATAVSGTAGGGVPGSPHQVIPPATETQVQGAIDVAHKLGWL